MNIIELKHINHKFTSGVFNKSVFHVLKDVDFRVSEGEIVAVVGESGCGKTTLGKIITGLIEPTEGEVLYLGNDIRHCSRKEKREYRRNVQFIQQDSYAALNPSRTIYQSLYAPVKANFKDLTRAQINEKINAVLEEVGLVPQEQYLKKYPHQLSGGQRQRILIARSISLDPKLIVADEPISMIDVSLRMSILRLISSLNAAHGIAFVYVTHDLATANFIANGNRVAVMYMGEIVESGAVREVIRRARHPYARALLSAVPIPDPEIERRKPPIPLKSLEVPDLRNRPAGCCFAERCVYADENCAGELETTEVGEEHFVRCKRVSEIPAWSIDDLIQYRHEKE